MPLATTRLVALALALLPAAASAQSPSPAPSIPVVERSLRDLQAGLNAGAFTSEQLVRAYLERIDAIDAAGPSLHSVLARNPQALDDARAADRARAAGHAHGVLFGIPILVKDNIETRDPLATTAGSRALAANVTHRDAPVVARLRAAGAIVLGKTNLSEWANIRSSHAISGWSALGGLVRNPYALDRTASGSSSGTGASIAASLAAAGLGTETDGSITSPSSLNGLVGLKPTVGLLSRTGVVPISHSQDTPGPMARRVADVAALLTVMAGRDPRDPATLAADAHRTDYVRALSGASLARKRLGVLHALTTGRPPAVHALFANALATLRARGATVIDVPDVTVPATINDDEFLVLLVELKADLNAYLAKTPAAVRARSLADVIAFDRRDTRELSIFDQDLFVRSQATHGLGDSAYRAARARSLAAARRIIDGTLARYHLDALVVPSDGPASRVDAVYGDQTNLGSASQLPAVAGYPHLTVPMGTVAGLPVGISFIGTAWSEATLLRLGAAFEAATHARRPPTFPPSLESTSYSARLEPAAP